MEYLDEEDPAFLEDRHFNDFSNDLMKLKFEQGISKENSNARNFIHHAHWGTVEIFLVANSQDKTHSSERFEKLDDEEVVM